ncbi:restriction endonuclease subunit S [Cetobacterium somerae]
MKNKVPKLRFPEFSGEWEEKKFGEVLFERKIKQKISERAPLLAFAAGQGVIDRSERKTNNRDFLTKDSTQKKYLLTKYNDIVYNPSNLKYGAIDRNKYGQGVISPIYVTFETSEIPSFIELIVKSENFKQRALQYEEGTVTKRQSVKPENLLSLNIIKPDLKEQEKIANFLSSVDIKIDKLEKKKELLEKYKKGMMQKLFSQKLRFKDENGNDYPEWEEKRLGEISTLITKGTTPKKFNENLFDKIKYIKIESLTNNKINNENCVFIDKLTHETELKRSILQENDLLFAIAGSLGKNAIVKKENLPANTNQALAIIRLSICQNYLFILQLLNSNLMKQYILENVSVGAQPNLNLEQINNFKFYYPSLPEQEKIANFLSSIDEKIELIEKELEKNKEFKKGLLQQMFI